MIKEEICLFRKYDISCKAYIKNQEVGTKNR